MGKNNGSLQLQSTAVSLAGQPFYQMLPITEISIILTILKLWVADWAWAHSNNIQTLQNTFYLETSGHVLIPFAFSPKVSELFQLS